MTCAPDRRARMLAKIRVHYEQGIHSKIPRCCVLAWCRAEITGEALPIVGNAGYRPCSKCAWKIRGGIAPASVAICDTITHGMKADYPWHVCGCDGKEGRWWWEVRYPIILKQYRRNGGRDAFIKDG